MKRWPLILKGFFTLSFGLKVPFPRDDPNPILTTEQTAALPSGSHRQTPNQPAEATPSPAETHKIPLLRKKKKHTASSCRGRSLSNYTCFILTSAFIHAPGLGPDFEWIWLFLPRSVRLVGGRRLRGGVVGQHLGAVRGGRGVPAAVARHALLGTVLAVFPFKWLL